MSAAVYEETSEVVGDVVLNHEAMIPPPQQQQPLPENVMPPIENLTIEARPPQLPVEPPMEQQTLPPEQLYYQQPPRPITEMLGTGSFYFLQVSVKTTFLFHNSYF